MDSDYRSQWLQAIKQRYSTRKFNNQPVQNTDIISLEECEAMLDAMYGNVRIRMEKLEDNSLFSGLGAVVGGINGAPYAAAFIGKANDPNVRFDIGMAGEKFILHATALGLKTCWVGGGFNKRVAYRMFSVDKDEEIFAICPIGHSDAPPSTYHSQRKPLAEIADLQQLASLPHDFTQAIEHARVAPSSINRQCWYFDAAENGITVSLAKNASMLVASKMLLIDLGIAASHIEIYMAEKAGIKGEWEYGKDYLTYKINT